MSEIRRYPIVRHLRGEASQHVLRYKRGQLVQQGRGLSFWFRPMTTSIAEVPVDDREVSFVIHARSSDFQDVVVQGAVEFRVADPQALASRVDFTIDLALGLHVGMPLERIDGLLADFVQRVSVAYLVKRPLAELLENGVDELRVLIEAELRGHEPIAEMGLEVLGVNVKEVSPEPEVARALQTKEREAIQQRADEATFERRALAVEKERAIQENELQNQVELARREEQLIAQRGENARRRATDEVDANRIAAEGEAEQRSLEARTEAERIRGVERAKSEAAAARVREVEGAKVEAEAAHVRDVEGAKVEAERERMAIYRELPSSHLLALAAQRFAEKLEHIDEISITPDQLGQIFQQFAKARALMDAPREDGGERDEDFGEVRRN